MRRKKQIVVAVGHVTIVIHVGVWISMLKECKGRDHVRNARVKSGWRKDPWEVEVVHPISFRQIS